MPCICLHDKLDHETERDAGWHEGKCTKCECTGFYAKRTYEKDLKNGFNMTYSMEQMYKRNFVIPKTMDCENK